jgi:hypothetical protein
MGNAELTDGDRIDTYQQQSCVSTLSPEVVTGRACKKFAEPISDLRCYLGVTSATAFAPRKGRGIGGRSVPRILSGMRTAAATAALVGVTITRHPEPRDISSRRWSILQRKMG